MMTDAGPEPAAACRCGAPAPDDDWSKAASAAFKDGAVLILDVWGGAGVTAEEVAFEDERRAAAMPEGRRSLYRAARHAARKALAAATGCDPGCIQIDATGDTQPVVAGVRCGGPLSDAVREYGIGFSYAGDRALVALAWRIQVGVDIEALPPPGGRQRRYDAIREAYFADPPAGGGTAAPADFLAAWTRHEAFLKACGDGITIPTRQRDPGAEGYTIHDMDTGDGYFAAVAAKSPSFRYRILEAPPVGPAQAPG